MIIIDLLCQDETHDDYDDKIFLGSLTKSLNIFEIFFFC